MSFQANLGPCSEKVANNEHVEPQKSRNIRKKCALNTVRFAADGSPGRVGFAI